MCDVGVQVQKKYDCDELPGMYVTKLISWSRINKFITIIGEIKLKSGGARVDFRRETAVQ